MAQVFRYAPGHDLVHFFVEPYALAASAVFPWPYLITVHGTYGLVPLRMNAVTRTLFARALKRAESVVCVSNYTRQRMAEALGLQNLAVVTNGLELPTPPAAAFAGQIAGEQVLMGAGALKPRKGYHTVVEALPRIRERYPNVHYYLVGDDQDTRYVDGLRRSSRRSGWSSTPPSPAASTKSISMPCISAPMSSCCRPRTAAPPSRGSG